MINREEHCRNAGTLFIGTSGYSYPDWKGIFYPRDLPANRYLEHYSKFFNSLELNSTFYRMPDFRSIRRLQSAGFKNLGLSIKAHQTLTHQRMELRVLKEFLDGLKPLTDSHELMALLFQYPYSFRPDNEAWDRLGELSHHVRGPVTVVEFRHRSWFRPDNLVRLTDLGLTVCALDMPGIEGLPGVQLPVTQSIGYMRFHGRNESTWWNHAQAWERYDYLYTEKQMETMLPSLQTWMEKHQAVYFFFNNHYRGQAVQNAQLLMAFLAD